MKFRLTALIIIMMLILPGVSHGANKEFRAVWVHNWLPGMLSDSQVDQTVRWAKDCNMNAVVVQVRRVGDAYYTSSYEPRANNIEAGDSYDPLGCVVQRAKAAGMEVHAWFNVYRIGTKTGFPPMSNHVGNQHPEWLSKDDKGSCIADDGQFLDPGVPEAREYLIKVISDLVRRYDVDGLMLDYVRYPGKNWGYNDIAVDRFNHKYGRTGKPSPDDPKWCDWRRDQVTETVRAIYKEVHRVKPGVKVSASTIAWGTCPSDFNQTAAYRLVFQDWRAWMREGILDANMPMNYKDPSSANGNQAFADWVTGAKRWSYGRHVYCGLMVYKDVAGAAQQISLSREKGAEGVVGLAFSQADYKDVLADKLKSTVFAGSASIPSMSWIKAGNSR